MYDFRKTRRVLLASVFVLGLYGAAAAAPPDAWVTTKSKIALLGTEGVSATDVNVDTVNGVVTLHGKVESEEAKRRAEEAVKKLDGVKQVRNLLQVVKPSQEAKVAASDDKIKEKVEEAIKKDAALSDVDVQSVNNGVVLLGGETKSLTAHLRALEVASHVPGVRKVVSEIKSPDQLADSEIYSDRPDAVAAAGNKASDMWITSAVKMRLIADEQTPGLDVNVDTRDGTVTLFGIVDSPVAKAAAEADARKVSGVKTVVNALEVVPPKKQEQVKETDDRVEERVEQAIKNQDELQDAKIKVEVENGVARLTGTVPSQAQRIRAAVVARTSPGVRAVRDDMQVVTN